MTEFLKRLAITIGIVCLMVLGVVSILKFPIVLLVIPFVIIFGIVSDTRNDSGCRL